MKSGDNSSNHAVFGDFSGECIDYNACHSLPQAELLRLLFSKEERLSPQVTRWLRTGFERWVAGRGDLEACLGLRTGNPGDRPRQAVGLAIRDWHLRSAGRLCAGGSLSALARELAGEIEAFESRVWLRWKNLGDPPEGASKLRAHLFEARRLSGKPLPTFRQLLRILP